MIHSEECLCNDVFLCHAGCKMLRHYSVHSSWGRRLSWPKQTVLQLIRDSLELTRWELDHCAHWLFHLPSNRHHRSNGDCKGENYQVCSVQYCVQQLCTVQCTHIWTDLTVLWIGFCLIGPISLCLDSFLCMYVFSVWLYIACMCSIVTWWGGPSGIEAYP